MARILLDVSRIVGRLLKGRVPTGIDRVGLAYVKHFRANARAVLCASGASLVCGPTESQILFDWMLSSGKSGMSWRSIAACLLSATASKVDPGSVFLNTGHSNLDRKRYIGMLQRRRVKPVLLIHDLIPITHPEYCREGEQARHQARIANALAIGSGIICNSQDTLDRLTNYCHRLGRQMPPALSASLAPGLPKLPPGPPPISEPYFVVLGTIEPRKNHLMLLQIWKGLIERLGESAPRLVLIGQRGWECEHVVRVLERSPTLPRFVTEMSSCPDEELAAVLHHARALLCPSFVEGYGLPIAEALTHGVPVIASDLPVFREFAGDVPDYLDPLDSLRWAQSVEAYCRMDSVERSLQLARMPRFSIPTWAEHFAKVDEFIDGIAPVERVLA